MSKIKMYEEISLLELGKVDPVKFAAKAFESSNYQEALEQITKRMQELDRELRSAVCSNSDELLQNASDVKFLRDKVISLKSQVTHAKEEAEEISNSIVNPFNRVKIAAQNLQNAYAICRVLRILLKYLGLVRQTEKVGEIKEIKSSSNDIRRFCEIYKIAKTGELNGIIAFEGSWSKLAPKIENMITLAKNQFIKGVQQSDSSLATSAAAVFDFLDTLQEFSQEVLQKEISKMCEQTRDSLRKAKNQTELQVIKDDMQSLLIYTKRANILYQAVLSRTALDKSTRINTKVIEPIEVVKAYSSSLRKCIEGLAEKRPAFSTQLLDEIHTVRNIMKSVCDRLPDSIDHREAFLALTESVLQFTDALIANKLKDIKLKLVSFVTDRPVPSTQVKLLCENLKADLASYDEELVQLFRVPLIQLTKQFTGFMKSANSQYAAEANRHAQALCAGLSSICSKFYTEETVNEIVTILSTKQAVQKK